MRLLINGIGFFMLLLACALAIVTCGLTANFLFDGNVIINGLFFCSSIIVVNVIFKKISVYGSPLSKKRLQSF
jgi:hypothetical protein